VSRMPKLSRHYRSVMDSLTPDETRRILHLLVARDPRLAYAIGEIAKGLRIAVSARDIAAHVRQGLELLDVEEVSDRSGAHRYGYVDPGKPRGRCSRRLSSHSRRR
jgi:hypothetical protein